MAGSGPRTTFSSRPTPPVASSSVCGSRTRARTCELTPILDDIERRTGKLPGEHLVDGGFVNLAAFTAAAARGITLYAPPMNPANPRPADAPRKHPDSPAAAQWRRRMERTESKEIYKLRAATAETVNADQIG